MERPSSIVEILAGLGLGTAVIVGSLGSLACSIGNPAPTPQDAAAPQDAGAQTDGGGSAPDDGGR